MLKPQDKSKLVEAVLSYSTRVCHSEKELSQRDQRLLAEVVISRSYLLLDLARDPRCAEGYWRALMSLKTLDARLYALTVKACRQLIIRVAQDYTLGSFGDLIHRFKPGDDDIFYKWMLTPLAHFEKESESELDVLIRSLQWVSYDTKLNLRDLDFSTELSIEYLDDEYAMSNLVYDEDLIRYLRDIVAEWCSGMKTVPETASWHFRHGNGATTETVRTRASTYNKCRFFTCSADDRAYLRWRGSCEGLNENDFLWKPTAGEETPIRVDFVPKTPLTNRVISPEHVTKMWLQNDLAWLMDRMFHESHVNMHLHDQAKSRLLALQGSVSGRYDTFDFSKASDFVTLQLVDQVTESTWLHDPLLWSRSKTAIVGEGSRNRAGLIRPVTISLRKFAPMGSSTCFNTEGLIFCAVCEAAVRLSLGRRSRSDDYLVYGDDCVIRSDCSDAFRFLSALLHLKVNDDKTCRYRSNHCFREACGIEAIDGVDVTPLRVSRRFVGTLSVIEGTATPGEAIGVCDMINRCHTYGFRNLRKYFCSILSNWDKYGAILRVDFSDFQRLQKQWEAGLVGQLDLPLPYFVVDDSTATNYRCKTRLNRALQRREAKIWTVRAGCRKIPGEPDYSGDVGYFLWLLQAQKWDCESCSALSLEQYVEQRNASGGGPLRWIAKWHWI